MREARERWLVVAACLVALAAGVGCPKARDTARAFDGVFKYRNRSADTLYVSGLTGFEHPVACGVLVADGTAGLHLWPMSHPPESTLRWRVGDGPEQTEVLKLDAVAGPRANAVLVLEYTKGGEWRVFFEPKR